MELLLIALIIYSVLGTIFFLTFLVVKNGRIKELNSEIRLYRQLTEEASKNNDWTVLVDNLNNYSAGIINRLCKIIVQSYQRLVPQWSLTSFGIFFDKSSLINNKEKKDFIKNTFTYALGLLDAKILADIVTKYLKEEGNFDEKNARVGLIFIMSVILKEGNAGQLATCFAREFKENIKELLDSSEITDDEKILIQAGLIKIKKMLNK